MQLTEVITVSIPTASVTAGLVLLVKYVLDKRKFANGAASKVWVKDEIEKGVQRIENKLDRLIDKFL